MVVIIFTILLLLFGTNGQSETNAEEGIVNLENVLQVSLQTQQSEEILGRHKRQQNYLTKIEERTQGMFTNSSSRDILDGNEIGLELIEEEDDRRNGTAENDGWEEEDGDLLMLMWRNEWIWREQGIGLDDGIGGRLKNQTVLGGGGGNGETTNLTMERRTTRPMEGKTVSMISATTTIPEATTPSSLTTAINEGRSRLRRRRIRKKGEGSQNHLFWWNTTPMPIRSLWPSSMASWHNISPPNYLDGSTTATQSSLSGIPAGSMVVTSPPLPSPFQSSPTPLAMNSSTSSSSSPFPKTTMPLRRQQCCPIGGVWTNWTPIGQCNGNCGGCGHQMYQRECISIAWGCPCIGESNARRECALAPCQFPRLSCCNGRKIRSADGIQGHQAICGQPPNPPANLPLPDCLCCPSGGLWGNWKTDGECSDSCGACGIRHFSRICISANWGCPCSGPISMDLICNQQPCTFPRLSCCGQIKVGANANRTAIICGHEEDKLMEKQQQDPSICIT